MNNNVCNDSNKTAVTTIVWHWRHDSTWAYDMLMVWFYTCTGRAYAREAWIVKSSVTVCYTIVRTYGFMGFLERKLHSRKKNFSWSGDRTWDIVLKSGWWQYYFCERSFTLRDSTEMICQYLSLGAANSRRPWLWQPRCSGIAYKSLLRRKPYMSHDEVSVSRQFQNHVIDTKWSS